MIRNFKVLMLASVAVAAFGALSASGASAAEYHCNVETGKSCTGTLFADGVGKASHHVFIVKRGPDSGALTCAALTAESTSAKTSPELTVKNLNYNTATGCTLAGSPATVDTAGCDYLFKANGGTVTLNCGTGGTIDITVGACTVEIPGQTHGGITYTNINSKKELTVSVNAQSFNGTAGAGCKGLVGFEGAFTEGEYTTGNTIIKGYKDGSAHTEANQVNFWWE